MNSRQRLDATLNHRQPDRVCVDFGSTAVTGMHVSAVSRLRQAVLGEPGYRVKVVEPYQMLGEIDEPLRAALGIDVAGITGRTTLFGFENTNWKPFEMFDGTPVLVPGEFVTTVDADGSLLIYPQGDRSVPPSGRMPRGGHFFDTIVRQGPIDESRLDPADNTEEFTLLSEPDEQHFVEQARLLNGVDCGVMMTLPGASFGDIALVPAPWLKRVRGIRDIAEWYMSTVARRDYVYAVFQRQCEVALANIRTLAKLVGDVPQVAFFTGADFGTQRGLFISLAAYRDLFQPFHRQVNDLIHRTTKWKTFIHSCGSVIELLGDFIDAGFDILNPVQTAAAGMDPRTLKREVGKSLVFWGGGVDTQGAMAFGKPAEVYRQVRERIEIFNDGGGFVFDAVHNVQANTPTENILAMFDAIRDSSKG